ncbi:cytochrome P450 2J2-like [Pelobates cultripes]|uniref:Cytochrome P450 2J2-like n=1 Tax=Pelobates cultripes TaxID=61616 RepID=A0AAD1VUB8_PELCU|nr:cytochrome P450 2J2-like [Pelobates cultripes]
MLGTTTVLLALLLGLLLLHLIKLRITAARLPPGPTPVPFFGNLWTLKFQLHHKTIMQLAKTYGNIITIWIGQTPIIVLHGYETIREGLIAKSEQLSMRAERPFFKYYANGRVVCYHLSLCVSLPLPAHPQHPFRMGQVFQTLGTRPRGLHVYPLWYFLTGVCLYSRGQNSRLIVLPNVRHSQAPIRLLPAQYFR